MASHQWYQRLNFITQQAVGKFEHLFPLGNAITYDNAMQDSSSLVNAQIFLSCMMLEELFRRNFVKPTTSFPSRYLKSLPPFKVKDLSLYNPFPNQKLVLCKLGRSAQHRSSSMNSIYYHNSANWWFCDLLIFYTGICDLHNEFYKVTPTCNIHFQLSQWIYLNYHVTDIRKVSESVSSVIDRLT